jgi:hypothetical protein
MARREKITDEIDPRAVAESIANTEYRELPKGPVKVIIEVPFDVADQINEEAREDNISFEIKTQELLCRGLKLRNQLRKQMSAEGKSILTGVSV